MQNITARLVTDTRRRDHITQLQKYVNSIGYPSKSVSSSKWHVWFARRCPGRHLSTLHILHNENRLFLSCRTWWTIRTLTPTAPFSDGAWLVWMVRLLCGCMIYMDQDLIDDEEVCHSICYHTECLFNHHQGIGSG